MGVFGWGRPGWGVIGRRVGCIGVGGAGGAVSVFGDFGLVVGGGALSPPPPPPPPPPLSVLGGFSAQSTCKCVVRKLVVYLVH